MTDPTAGPAEKGMPSPLDGIRVIDLTPQGPGPMCSQLLGQLGAEIIKVERGTGPPGGRPNPWLVSTRAQIRSVVMDLKKPAAREVFCRLVQTAQVVMEGFRPGVAARLGVDYGALRRVGADPVYVSISGFGQTGRYSSRPGHDLNYVALAGVLSMSAPDGAVPPPPGILVADFAAGAFVAAIAVLAGLHQWRAIGRGQYIDLSMHDAVVHAMARFIVPYLEGDPLARHGNDFLTGAAPWYGVYTAADGRLLAVAAFEDHFFEALCAGLGLDGWADAQWERDRWPVLRAAMAAAFRRHDRDEWIERLGSNCCVSPVYDIAEVAADPHLRDRRVIVERPDGVLGMGPILPLASVRHNPTARARRQGEDTEAILEELGYSEAERSSLREARAIGDGGSTLDPPGALT